MRCISFARPSVQFLKQPLSCFRLSCSVLFFLGMMLWCSKPTILGNRQTSSRKSACLCSWTACVWNTLSSSSASTTFSADSETAIARIRILLVVLFLMIVVTAMRAILWSCGDDVYDDQHRTAIPGIQLLLLLLDAMRCKRASTGPDSGSSAWSASLSGSSSSPSTVHSGDLRFSSADDIKRIIYSTSGSSRRSSTPRDGRFVDWTDRWASQSAIGSLSRSVLW